MKLKPNQTLTTLLALCWALLLPDLCRADVFNGPNGTWSSHGTGPSNAVWDVSSIPDMTSAHVYVSNKNAIVDVECPIDPLNQNGSGKISGAGSSPATLQIDDDSGFTEQTFTSAYSIKGSIAGGKGKARGTLMESISGVADIEGMRKVKASRTTKFTIDSVAGTVSSSQNNHASAAGKGSISSNETNEPELLSNVFTGDGSWTLDMELTTSGKKVEGTATVTLDSGRVFHYTVKGTYNPTTMQSRLGLKGNENAKGSVLQVQMNADVVTLIKGKISGQAVNVANP